MSAVSVIISTFNRARYIEEALDSVLAQSHPVTQVIVVDDGSSDDTALRLQRYGGRIETIHQANAGKAAALNRAMPLVRGDYVWIFDDDDVALPDSVERRLQPLLKRQDVDFVYSGHYLGHDGPDGRIVRGRQYDLPAVREGALFQTLAEGAFFNQQGMLARRSCYSRVGPYDESFNRSQDYELMLRMARLCHGVSIPRPTYIFRQHPGVRGPQGAQHGSEERDRIWMSYEGRIGRRMREQLPLEAFLDDEQMRIGDARLRKRLALLQRAASMASKGLVDEVCADLVDAIQADPVRPLDATSKATCRRAMTREFMQAVVRSEPERLMSGLRPLRGSRVGRQILRALFRGQFWVIRRQSPLSRGSAAAITLGSRLLWASFV